MGCFIDQSRNTCLIERVDENSNVVQMGLTPVEAPPMIYR